jgi:hypothetical protein
MQVKIDTVDAERVARLIKSMDLKQHDREIKKILKSSVQPITSAAKKSARSKYNKNKNTYEFERAGTKYIITPGHLAKAIGVLPLRKQSSFAVEIGYRASGKYDGWFGHFVDAGTKHIKGKNVMPDGQKGFPKTSARMMKAIVRLEKKILSK